MIKEVYYFTTPLCWNSRVDSPTSPVNHKMLAAKQMQKMLALERALHRLSKVNPDCVDPINKKNTRFNGYINWGWEGQILEITNCLKPSRICCNQLPVISRKEFLFREGERISGDSKDSNKHHFVSV